MQIVSQLLIEFFARGIWESALFLYNILFFSDVAIRKKSFLLFSFGLALFALVIRHLPISTGIHTLLIMVLLNLIAVWFYRVPLERSVRSSLIITVILFALEGINGGLILLLKGSDKLFTIRTDPILKIVYFLPSLVCFVLITIAITKILNKKRKMRQSNAEQTEQQDL